MKKSTGHNSCCKSGECCVWCRQTCKCVPFRTPSALAKTQRMIRKVSQFYFGTSDIDGYSFNSSITYRRKFRSQTSDNMGRWKAEMGRGREKRRAEERRSEKRKSQKIQVREKVGKSRNAVFFQWFVAPGGRKVGSLKRRVQSHLARWEMKKCTPLWCEAHL